MKCTSLHGVEIKWSFGRICKKKRVTDHDFPPPFMWAENNKKRCRTTISFVCCYSKTLSRGTVQGKINFSTENVTKNFFEKTSSSIQNTERCYPSGKNNLFLIWKHLRNQPWLKLLELFTCFVGYQGNFPRVFRILKKIVHALKLH